MDTAAPYSDLRTVETVRGLTGALTAALPNRRGRFRLVVERAGEPEWTLEATRSGANAAMTLTVRTPGVPVAHAEVRTMRGGTVRLLLARRSEGDPLIAPTSDGTARVRVVGIGNGAVVRFGATRASGARFDLRLLSLDRVERRR